MKTSEQFALNEWLSYYPENMTYEEVIALMREPDNAWSVDEISVWQVVEDFTLDQVADFIESTQSHFERVTAHKPAYKCNKCSSIVTTNKRFVSQDYFAFCRNCDEDMYQLEVKEVTA